MKYHLKPKDTIRFGDRLVIVMNPLSAGQQAHVYRVFDMKTKQILAMKHLFGRFASDRGLFYDKVKSLTKLSSPHPDLVWPLAVSEYDQSTDSFLFLMELVPPEYQPVAYVMKHPDILTTAQRRELSLKLTDVFEMLQKPPLIYSDISEKNILYRVYPDGSVGIKVIDCDNISLPGKNLGLMGTGLFRAPELFRDPSNAELTATSDRHALAVAVFRIMVGCHPLDGRKVKEHPFSNDNIVRFFGEEPEYVFSPSRSNLPTDPNCAQRLQALDRALVLYFSLIFSHECLMLKQKRPPVSYLRMALERCR